jgi:hypothetical protein
MSIQVTFLSAGPILACTTDLASASSLREHLLLLENDCVVTNEKLRIGETALPL